ncbi:MAG: ABC transporter permease [Actinomycetota bacterium]
MMFGHLERRTLILLAIVWIGFGLSVSGFFGEATFASIFGRSVDNGLIAAGFTVALLSGQIDLSVGSLYALSGVVFASVEPTAGIAGGFAAALAVGLVVGLINGTLIGRFRLDSFVATLGTLMLARGAAFVVSGGKPVNASNLDASLWLNKVFFGPISPRVVILIVFIILAHLLVTRTRIGRELVAVGGDKDAATAIGIPVSRRILTAMIVSSLAASLGGAIAAMSLLAGSPIVGDANLLVVIAAVFLGGAALTGGVGSVLATAVAVVVLSSIATGMELAFIQKAWQSVVTGVIIIVASAPLLRDQAKALVEQVRTRIGSRELAEVEG